MPLSPSASPGGWQLIGRTAVPFFTPWTLPYARLAAGDRVQFTRSGATGGEGEVSVAGPSSDWPVPPATTPSEPAYATTTQRVFLVAEAGVRTVLQDAGRVGVAALGVPAASPADPDSLALANRLVGNPAQACALEVMARGPTLHCLSPSFVAIVGARPEVRLDGQPVPAGQVVPVNAGQELVIGPVRGGFRCYLALAGGFVGTPVFGSCSSDQLAGLGPGPIARDSYLWGAPMEPPLGDHLQDGTVVALNEGEPIALRVVPGPHPEQFVPGAFAALGSMRFTAETESNRVGLRLRRHPHGPQTVLVREHAGEIDSQGMVTGAVQVPPSGEPVILLPDHATLGGYPVLAVVAEVDHGILGQCAPGTDVVLVPIDHGRASDVLRRRRRAVHDAVVGHYPLVVE
jgi:biotin-dependent carboxylase-like uncharacterized protein